MKLVNLCLSACVLILAITACSEKKSAPETKPETQPTVQAVDTKGLKIAFYYTDSLKNGFTYYKNEDARITKKGEAFQNEMIAKQRSLEQMAANYDKYMREGTMTGADLQSLENEIIRKRDQLMQMQQTRGAQLEQETAEALEVLSNKIDVAGKKYCEKYGIDILLKHGPGGQINFINDKMNVTQSFIEFLNNEQAQINKDLGK
jgi:Skp family chaperone for outer membrane proteins